MICAGKYDRVVSGYLNSIGLKLVVTIGTDPPSHPAKSEPSMVSLIDHSQLFQCLFVGIQIKLFKTNK
jgi:hypothetical protein